MPVSTLWSSLQARLPSSLLGGVQRAGEPPLVRPQIPLLGDSIRFGRDAGNFLNAHRREHGDVFTVLIAGHRMTFMLDPLSIPLFLRQTGALRFREMADQMGVRAFGYSRRILEESEQADVYKLFNEHLKGEALTVLGARMAETVALHVAAAAQESGGRDVGLYALVKRCIFAAGTQTLFGDSVLAPDSQADFEHFDRVFSLLVAGVPAGLLPGVKRAQQRLAMRLHDLGPTASTLIRARQDYYHNRGDRHDRARVMLTIFWAAQANTFPAAFWALAYLLSDPKALAAIRAELAQAGPDLGEASLDRMVRLDSAIKEALRLCTGSIVLRQAAQDLELPLDDGRRFLVRAGDRVCLYPYLMHHDPEIFPEPERFQYDRFLAAEGPPQFCLRGKRLTLPLMPYGGGVSMCPGRFLAHQEIKIFVAVVLKGFDVELGGALPPYELTRAGLGTFPPAHDVPSRWRQRA